MITVGILVSYIVNYIFADAGAWRWMLGLAVVPSVILLIGILFMPESPRWLFTIGKEEKAREILSSLRGTKNIDDEIDQMKEAEKENEGGLKELFEPWVRPALIAGLGLAFCSNSSGQIQLFITPRKHLPVSGSAIPRLYWERSESALSMSS